MKTIYYTPAQLWCRIRRQENDIKIAEKALNESYKIHHGLLDALEDAYERVAKGLPVGVTIEEFTCETCKDTHQMTLGDGEFMCTFCPSPCAMCRGGGSAYCKHTPCHCDCHKKMIDCPSCEGGTCADCNWVGHLKCKTLTCKCQAGIRKERTK